MIQIDNVNTRLGDDLRDTLRPGAKLSIAAANFSIYAFEALREELEAIDELRFLFTNPVFVEQPARQSLGQRREFYLPGAGAGGEVAVHGSPFEIRLRNRLTQRAIARECADWIRRKTKFKSITTTGHLPIGITVDRADGERVHYFNVPGFTTTDLGLERGDAYAYAIGREEGAFATSMLQQFETLWRDRERLADVTEQLCASIETVYRENSPKRIYYLTLYTIFRSFLEDVTEDVLPKERLNYRESLVWKKLFNFQNDAATGIINKLETYNGCILADSVGLGKTFTALAVIRYYEMRNDRVLVLCPKKLEQNWLTYNAPLTTNIFAEDRFNYEVFAHTDLQRSSGFANGRPIAQINWGAFDLVVIDESHNFRNGGTGISDDSDEDGGGFNRYEILMSMVIKSGVRTKVLMLSATPVNNRFTDLKNQLALAYEGRAEVLEERLHVTGSIDDIFRQAQTAFNRWTDLDVEERTTEALIQTLDFNFFELLDSVTIARSRKHIETYYDTTAIGSFPKRRKPISIRCQLTHRPGVYDFNDIFQRLSALELSVYTPLRYVLHSRRQKYEDLYSSEAGEGRMLQSSRESGVKALMTTNLLKRLESSVHAFRLTLAKLAVRTDETLNKIDAFKRSGGYGSLDWGSDNVIAEDTEDEFEDGTPQVGGRYKFDLADMDVEGWREDLATDRAIVADLIDAMQSVKPADDAKLQNLLTHVLAKADAPINPGNKKVLVFTAFADTAEYLYEHLAAAALNSRGIHTGLVTGSAPPRTTHERRYDFQSLLTLFSPQSKSKHLALPNDDNALDFLVATDCISEGQNLQDCDYLINYDIHWNPVRIIQRFGRVDRIGSPNKSIQLVNYWPDISLDEYINLKERVENRMVIAGVTATGDDNVLTNQNSNASYRREQLTKLQDEVIELEDARSGIALTDLGLNDFQMDLVSHVREEGPINKLPKGLHAVLPAAPERGLPEGVVFVLRSLRDNPELARHNRLHPHYLMYVRPDGTVVEDHTMPKRLLDLLRAHCRGVDEPVEDVCRTFNSRTRDGADMETYSQLLTEAIGAMVARKQDKDVASLFSAAASTALQDGFRELGDFELTAFFIVEPR